MRKVFLSGIAKVNSLQIKLLALKGRNHQALGAAQGQKNGMFSSPERVR
jgi:hypothetical protein